VYYVDSKKIKERIVEDIDELVANIRKTIIKTYEEVSDNIELLYF